MLSKLMMLLILLGQGCSLKRSERTPNRSTGRLGLNRGVSNIPWKKLGDAVPRVPAHYTPVLSANWQIMWRNSDILMRFNSTHHDLRSANNFCYCSRSRKYHCACADAVLCGWHKDVWTLSWQRRCHSSVTTAAACVSGRNILHIHTWHCIVFSR